MTINIIIYSGIALIILGAILYFVSCYMVKYYEKKEKEINRHIFEILRPKIKLRKNKLDNKQLICLNTFSNKGESMKAIMYVMSVWLMLGILISFVA